MVGDWERSLEEGDGEKGKWIGIYGLRYHIGIKGPSVLVASIPLSTRKTQVPTEKILSYSGFEPKTFMFLVKIATN
jgi:hypothetical protein